MYIEFIHTIRQRPQVF